MDYKLFVPKRHLRILDNKAGEFADGPDEVWHEFMCEVRELEEKIAQREAELAERKG